MRHFLLKYPLSPGTTHLYSESGPYSWTRMHHSALAKLRQFGARVKEDIVPGVTLLYLFNAEDIRILFHNEASQFIHCLPKPGLFVKTKCISLRTLRFLVQS